MQIYFLIPARKGSKGIPQKNISFLGNKPLVSHVVDRLIESFSGNNIIISTDDETIISLYKKSTIIHKRSTINSDDNATLDDVALEVKKFLEKEKKLNSNDILITCQPTSPFTKIESINKTIELLSSGQYDSVISAVEDRHLRWLKTDDSFFPQYKKRLNRQELPYEFTETGGIIGTTFGCLEKYQSRIGEKITLIETDSKEGIDIDNFSDWALASFHLKNLKIVLRADGGNTLGFGHLYRILALANLLIPNEIVIVTNKNQEFLLGYDFLKKFNYEIVTVENDFDFFTFTENYNPDIIINDILDTTESYITSLKKNSKYIVNLEDLGSGSKKADLVINELYPSATLSENDNEFSGVEYSILNSLFELKKKKEEIKKEVKKVLLTFGGTDPSNLSELSLRAFEILKYNVEILVVLGPGNMNKKSIRKFEKSSKLDLKIYENIDDMASLISSADLAITSAGRTVTELIAMRTPGLVMCQNVKELTHTHASAIHGVINLGLGINLSPEVLSNHIKTLIDDYELRNFLFKKMKIISNKRSNLKVVDLILKKFKEKNENIKCI